MTVTPTCDPDQASVRVRLSAPRSHLTYTVEVSGTQPVFTLEDTLGRTLLSSDQAPDNGSVWTRRWPQAPGDVPPAPQRQVGHALVISFAGAFSSTPTYRFKVELERDGSVQTIKECEYVGTAQTDVFREALRVRLRR